MSDKIHNYFFGQQPELPWHKKENKMSQLELKSMNFTYLCDGCRKEIYINQKMISGIESCCHGGCVRRLCIECIKFAYELIKDEK